ncbi:MAG: hypothetical protein EG825_11985 [Rhodocyclaceae bacterium]|nr:hypothetical protein [Rhodocyclaceae bacterium]
MTKRRSSSSVVFLDSEEEGAKKRLAAYFLKRFFVRFHVSLILAFAFAVGLLSTKGFLALGLDTMHWRWPLALLLAYGAFLLGVRAWLSYVGLGRYLDDKDGNDGVGAEDVVDAVSNLVPDGTSIDLPNISGSGIGDAIGSVVEHAGSGGGGGASGDFSSALTDSGGSSGFSLPDLGDVGDLGGDDGCLPIIVVILILALLAAVLGVGVYLVWQAPFILTEAAFEAALAAGLVKAARRTDDPGWIGGALSASWKPFLLIFIFTLAVAALAESFAPEARTLMEAIDTLLSPPPADAVP